MPQYLLQLTKKTGHGNHHFVLYGSLAIDGYQPNVITLQPNTVSPNQWPKSCALEADTWEVLGSDLTTPSS